MNLYVYLLKWASEVSELGLSVNCFYGFICDVAFLFIGLLVVVSL